MARAERSVVHVLPHAGGGGDTYVDLLADMPGYRMQRVYLAPQRKPGARWTELIAVPTHSLCEINSAGGQVADRQSKSV